MRILPIRLMARLLHLANAERSVGRDFYEFKTSLLKRYGECRGGDIQEITYECWGDKRDEYGDWYGCGPQCRRCRGTGIYDQRWIRLQRWRLGKYTFHIPIDSTNIKPDAVHIKGRIEHPDYGLKSREAQLWLYLLSGEFKRLGRACRSSCSVSPGWWPMCRAQKVFLKSHLLLMRVKYWFRRRTKKPDDVSEVPF